MSKRNTECELGLVIAFDSTLRRLRRIWLRSVVRVATSNKDESPSKDFLRSTFQQQEFHFDYNDIATGGGSISDSSLRH